jgi:hypothetical protein
LENAGKLQGSINCTPSIQYIIHLRTSSNCAQQHHQQQKHKNMVIGDREIPKSSESPSYEKERIVEVTSLDGSSFSITVKAGTSTAEVKALIETHQGIQADQIHLFAIGPGTDQIEDCEVIEDINVVSDEGVKGKLYINDPDSPWFRIHVRFDDGTERCLCEEGPRDDEPQYDQEAIARLRHADGGPGELDNRYPLFCECEKAIRRSKLCMRVDDPVPRFLRATRTGTICGRQVKFEEQDCESDEMGLFGAALVDMATVPNTDGKQTITFRVDYVGGLGEITGGQESLFFGVTTGKIRRPQRSFGWMYQEPSKAYAGRECLAFAGLPLLSKGDLIRLELDAEAGELSCWWNHCKQHSITGVARCTQPTFSVGSAEGGDEWSIVRNEDQDCFHALVDAKAATTNAATTKAATTADAAPAKAASSKAPEANETDGEQAEADTTSAHEATNTTVATDADTVDAKANADDCANGCFSNERRADMAEVLAESFAKDKGDWQELHETMVGLPLTELEAFYTRALFAFSSNGGKPCQLLVEAEIRQIEGIGNQQNSAEAANPPTTADAASATAASSKAPAKATEANETDGEQAEADTASAHEATNTTVATEADTVDAFEIRFRARALARSLRYFPGTS